MVRHHWDKNEMGKSMTPDERAERLQQSLRSHIVPVGDDGIGLDWMLTTKGVEKIAAAIREAEAAALERAAQLCDCAAEESLASHSHIGPDYFVSKALVSRELAAAIRSLKR
jgi:hypothetical protein